MGLAEKYMAEYAGEVPLVLKVNGKTSIPSDARAFSPLTATVEDAVRLGADAVGYTLFVGSPAQDQDILQFNQIRGECQRLGMPLIVWAYPRGEAIEVKGGRDSIYAVDYAARVANDLGADMVKINIPVYNEERSKQYPEPYNTLKLDTKAALKKVVSSAGKTMTIISGGEKMGDKELFDKVRASMEAGATGFIFGRNIWQRPYAEALKVVEKTRKLLSEFPS